jgi:hypothetical protein
MKFIGQKRLREDRANRNKQYCRNEGKSRHIRSAFYFIKISRAVFELDVFAK